MTVDQETTDKSRPFTPEDIEIIKAVHRGIQYMYRNSTPETFNKEEQLLTMKDEHYSDPETGMELVLSGIHQEMVIDGRAFAVSDFREGTTINGVPHEYYCKTVYDEKKEELIYKRTIIDDYVIL